MSNPNRPSASYLCLHTLPLNNQRTRISCPALAPTSSDTDRPNASYLGLELPLLMTDPEPHTCAHS